MIGDRGANMCVSFRVSLSRRAVATGSTGLHAVWSFLAAGVVGLWWSAAAALAEPVISAVQPVDTADVTTLSIVSEDFTGPLRWMADDLADSLNEGGSLRVLPVFGFGGNEIAPDALYLKSMDVAFVHSDFLAYAKRHGLHSDIENRLRYIASLYMKDIAIIAGDSIAGIRELAGRKVNLDNTTSSSLATSASIFELLGIEVEEVLLSHSDAMGKLKSGEIAATVVVDDKPNTMIATLLAQDGLRLVPVELGQELEGVYEPTSFTHDDYPNLIPSGENVEGVGVNVVMAMYNWPPNNTRYSRVARFVDMFFEKLPQLQAEPHHPNWQKVNLAASLAGWKRFRPAEDWLTRRNKVVSGEGALAKLREMFQKFLELQAAGSDQPLTDAEKAALFKLFLAWKENPDEASIKMQMTAVNGNGKVIGVISAENTEVTLLGNPQVGLLFKPDLTGLTPGSHAFQIHANPDCGPDEQNGIMVPGLAAGGALQLVGQDDSQSGNLGDLPPLIVEADGTAKQDIVVPGLNMADLLDRSIMIFANGNADSARIACGVVN